MLTALLASDHITNGFGKLAQRVAMLLDHQTVEEVIMKLDAEGYGSIDIRLALGAAKLIRQDGWPLKLDV